LPDLEGNGAMAATATHEDTVPIEDYERLDLPDLFAALRTCSQAELTRVEAHERAHGDRRPVLDKLRYLRGREPVAGYDAMAPDEILASLADADIPVLHDARGYETKMRHRADVLEGLGDLRRARRAGDGTTGAKVEAAAFVPDLGNPIARLAASIGMTGILILAAVLFVCSVFIGAIVVLSAIAPNALG
jgi:hypothetical protein